MAYPIPHPLAGLLTSLTFTETAETADDPHHAAREHEARRWHQRITRTRDMQRLRFTAAGVHLANNVLFPWTPDAARLPDLPLVMEAVRDVRLRHWTGGSMGADVAEVYEALDARGRLPSQAALPWGWHQPCPAGGSPLCDLGHLVEVDGRLVSVPRDTCPYCRGAGLLLRPAHEASTVDGLVYLCALGVRRGEAVLGLTRELGRELGLPVDRVAWAPRGPWGEARRTDLQVAVAGQRDPERAREILDAIVEPDDDRPFGFLPQKVRRGTAVVDVVCGENHHPLDLRRRLPSLPPPPPPRRGLLPPG